MTVNKRGPFRPSSTTMRAVLAAPRVVASSIKQELTRVLANESLADKILVRALAESGLQDIPQDPEPFELFLRNSIVPHIVPFVRLDQLEDFVERTIGTSDALELSSKVMPAAKPRVIMYEKNTLHRASISRELLRIGFDIEVIENPVALLSMQLPRVLFFELDPATMAVAPTIARQRDCPTLVTYDNPNDAVFLTKLRGWWPGSRIRLVAKEASPSEIAQAIRAGHTMN